MKELTLNDLAQSRGPGQLRDSKFMSAAEKTKVLKHWEMFLRGGLEKKYFSEALYKHLTNHCSFIAHYDIHGFYATYFESGDDTLHFLSQFDTRQGIPCSIEYGMTYWLTGDDYYDVNTEMCRIAWRYIPALEAKARNEQRHSDLTHAVLLLKKHGIDFPGGTV
ncbi:hypothetical protein B1772_03465 [Dehalococcoides mccartyi]|jgi:hypothetical protein|uniref:hypothetical protein n=1 Tax=Dehalococcoides mccartyi TaxID=61435 RepID=UPI00099DE580|nr:hypothetical protein [Dehalococcoides mccartyi]AQX74563.1 hypothetical protein B1776_03155 [Dehalococcoides mccartyi]AQY73141.1 hypothetical protein B1772_03465 [Dehalococcoides mccartyi]